jgi:hypothetical protein
MMITLKPAVETSLVVDVPAFQPSDHLVSLKRVKANGTTECLTAEYLEKDARSIYHI